VSFPQRSSRRRPSPLYLLLFLVVALVLYLYQSGRLDWLGLPRAARVVTAPSGGWVQAYFTSPDYADAAPHQGGVDSLVAADIAAAQKSVDVVSFEFNLPAITQALIDAHQRGVRVQLVLDDGNLQAEGMAQATEELDAAGIPIVYDQRKAFMHDKFVIVDQRILWVGSWNLTDSDTYRNNNNVLRIELPQLIENYAREFEEMFVDRAFGPTSPADTPYPVLQLSDDSRVENYFSPEEDARAAIIAQLRQAKEEILFMAFSFTDDEIGRVLLEKAQEGVRVRGVFEKRQESEYSEYSLLHKAGLDVRLDGNPRTMHHKVFVIDGQVILTGSYNFTSNAAENNDENVLVIDNTDLARSYQEEFDRVYQAAEQE